MLRHSKEKNVVDMETISRSNREAWNEVAPLHAKAKRGRLFERAGRPDFTTLKGIKKDTLLTLGIEGKSLVHACCNDGRDLISLKRLGAGRCFGFDLSDAFIEQGAQLARAAKVDIELIQADVYKLGPDYNGQFDIAVITAGTLRYLPDLETFFAVVKRLMKPGGRLFVQEMHPLLDMYSMESSEKPRKPVHSYFTQGAYKSTRGLDYYRVRAYRAKPCYRFHHKLSDVIQAVLNSGWLLETLQERDNDVSGGRFARLQTKSIHWPLSYIMTARCCEDSTGH